MITALPRIAIALQDYAAALRTFRDGFGLPVVDLSEETVPALGAHIGMCIPEGGSNIELMCPAAPGAPLAQALQKFLDRRGVGPYALMLEAPAPDTEADELAARGVDVLPLMAGAGGRDVHPRSTHGVLMRVYPDRSFPGVPRPSTSGLSGIARVVIATGDATLAAKAYDHGLGLTVSDVVEDDVRGVRCATAEAPKGAVIELVSALDTDRPFAAAIDRHVRARGEGMYALVLQSADPPAAVAGLLARGVAAAPSGEAADVVALGTRFIIEPVS